MKAKFLLLLALAVPLALPLQAQETRGVVLYPVELRVKSSAYSPFNKRENQLRVATLESAFGGSGYTFISNSFEHDRDSFRIRMMNPELSGSGTMKVRLSTENANPAYNSAPREIELVETGTSSGEFISHPQILVSNDADANHVFSFPGSTDTHRTHKIALGGKLIMEVDPSGGTKYQRLVMATVPVEKTVKVKPIVLKKGTSQVISDDEVAKDMKTLQETFAQCGIKIIVKEPYTYISESEVSGSFRLGWMGLRDMLI